MCNIKATDCFSLCLWLLLFLNPRDGGLKKCFYLTKLAGRARRSPQYQRTPLTITYRLHALKVFHRQLYGRRRLFFRPQCVGTSPRPDGVEQRTRRSPGFDPTSTPPTKLSRRVTSFRHEIHSLDNRPLESSAWGLSQRVHLHCLQNYRLSSALLLRCIMSAACIAMWLAERAGLCSVYYATKFLQFKRPPPSSHFREAQ